MKLVNQGASQLTKKEANPPVFRHEAGYQKQLETSYILNGNIIEEAN